jgi:predicted secreted protein
VTTIKLDEVTERIESQSGEAFTLEVPGANTTGYLWQIKTDPSVVQLIEHEIVPDEENFGGAGIERFVLKLLRTGVAKVHLELKAPWEEQPVETYDLQVHSVARDSKDV